MRVGCQRRASPEGHEKRQAGSLIIDSKGQWSRRERRERRWRMGRERAVGEGVERKTWERNEGWEEYIEVEVWLSLRLL